MDENKELKELIEKELRSDLKYLEQLNPNDERYSVSVDNIARLYDMIPKDDKIEKDRKDQKIDRMVKYGLETANIVLPLIFYGVWMKRGLRFEENGTFTSTTFRGLFQKFKPTK